MKFLDKQNRNSIIQNVNDQFTSNKPDHCLDTF